MIIAVALCVFLLREAVRYLGLAKESRQHPTQAPMLRPAKNKGGFIVRPNPGGAFFML